MASAENKITLPQEVAKEIAEEITEETVEALAECEDTSGTIVPKGSDESKPASYIVGNAVFSCGDRLPASTRQVTSQECFHGYEKRAQNPFYRTSNASYGGQAPTVHTMPTAFHARTQKFSGHLGLCGMYRNKSLNTAMDTSKV